MSKGKTKKEAKVPAQGQSKESAEKKQKAAAVSPAHTTQEPSSPPTWSEWIWEAEQKYYYRAKKVNDAWQYETSNHYPTTVSLPIARKEQTPRFLPETRIEYQTERKIEFQEQRYLFEPIVDMSSGYILVAASEHVTAQPVKQGGVHGENSEGDPGHNGGEEKEKNGPDGKEQDAKKPAETEKETKPKKKEKERERYHNKEGRHKERR